MAERRIGRFRIVAPLGKGGMASVWRAEDELLGRTVALKLLADDLAGSESARRRFRHEAEIATMLGHPAIAPVFGHGEDDGATWIAMALIDGETVSARLGRELPPPAEALRIALAAAEALGYAHARGVVHRDVSSNNVMLARDGRVFVMDFGLARADGLSRVTSTGVALGTFRYMAPEVLSGAAATPGSDLYALGVVLFELLTGSTPFAGDRLEVVAYRSANEDPEPPSRRRSGLSPAIDAFVTRAIAREPQARFRDADEFVGALRTLLAAGEAAPAGAAADPGAGVLAHALAPDGVLYLAVAAIEAGSASVAPLAGDLTRALRARLPGPQRLHVAGAEAPADPGAWRAFAREHGVNAVLAGRLRESGARVRVELWLVDPETGARHAGRHADGLAFEPFALEDAAVEVARAVLGLPDDLENAPTQPVRRDPAAEEHFAQAQRYLERHDHEAAIDGAIALLERLTVTESPRAEWFAALARACLAKLRLSTERAWEGRAAQACERALALAPESPETLVAHADLQENAGHTEAAVAGYRRALAIRPATLDAWLGLARALERAGRWAEAEDACRRAIALRPEDWRGYSVLGLVYLRQGRWEQAAEPWRRVLKLTPDNSRGARDLGTALHQMGRIDEAIALYERSIHLQPSAIAYTNLGTARFLTGEREASVEAFRKATALRPGDPLAWGNLGNAARQMPEGAAEARTALERAVALMLERLERNPVDALGWARLASWQQACGQDAAAGTSLERALALAPDDVECLLQATHFHQMRGDRERTLHWLRALLARGYDPALVRRSAQLSALRGDPEFEQILGATQSHRTGGDSAKELQ